MKAVPRPSKGYRETVCCAGITAAGEWRRLYPIRFRQLAGAQQFARWQWVDYASRQPVGDRRNESRRVEENTLTLGTVMPARDRLRVLLPLLRASTREATARTESLALIEPRNLTLAARAKRPAVIDAEREAFRSASRQQQMFDREVTDFEPCPYAVAIAFTDHDGTRHAPQCGDWETTATFFNMRRRGDDDNKIIDHLRAEFTAERPGRRIFLAMGTVAKRPSQWLLLGVLRVSEQPQLALGI